MTGRARRLGRALLALALLACACTVALGLGVWLRSLWLPLPPALRRSPERGSVRVLDRDGRLIRELRSHDSKLSEAVSLDEVSPWLVPALLAAEDARFFQHHGVDPLAIARAAGQALWAGELVSGASTLTQQLAKHLVPRARTLGGKLEEMALALRLERSLCKRQILEEYLNRIEFGPNLRGIQAASRSYLDKPARELDLAESATLVALVRGPTLYDPRRGLERVLRRRNRILLRMRERGLARPAMVQDALAQPLRLERAFLNGGAEHLVLALADGRLAPELRGERVERVESTLDAALQRELETDVRRAARYVQGFAASAAALIVVDNPTGDVLAYVGSPDFYGEHALGQNDGVRALRQPGSTLKPFVYAAAFEQLGMTAATLLPDVALTLPVSGGVYAPHNYDGLFHGPVRLREALANSLNVPAVYTVSRVGPELVLRTLRRFGFASLDAPAEHYGAALALGDGEVRLSELAQAYATLARGGVFLPLRFLRAATLAGGARLARDAPRPERVLDARVAALLADMLSDDRARSAEFGRDGPLALPFAVAAKTGTSKAFRDNWAVGFNHEVTVAVWVGNFDGSSMVGSTGVTGAGPLFHEAMLAAMRGRTAAPLLNHAGLFNEQVCALSGELAGPDCPHPREEWFLPEHRPTRRCSMHRRLSVDPENGLRAGPHCAGAESRVFEDYPPQFAAFAEQAARPVAPRLFSPRCPASGGLDADQRPELSFPSPAASFVLDRDAHPNQQLLLEARASTERVTFFVDDQRLGETGRPFRLAWSLTRGRHRAVVEGPVGRFSEPVEFEVR